jgi:2-oxoisovalerate dehydrogenase E2 component (dihydrolipoyl transacylase)
MGEIRQFKLPDVGEGLTEADILRWLVQPGDTVTVNQIIVEIETAKAAVELPSPHAGVVSALLVGEGDTVDVGTPIIAIDTGASDNDSRAVPVDPPPLQTSTSADLVPPPPAEAAEPDTAGTDTAGTDTAGTGAAPARQAVLVGYGVKLGSTVRRTRKNAPAPAPVNGAAAAPPAPTPAAAPAAPSPAGAAALAKPPVRKLARDLGVDLTALSGTGPQGSITR